LRSALAGGGRLVSVLSALVGWRLVGRRLLRAGLLRASLARGRRSVAALIALLLVGRRLVAGGRIGGRLLLHRAAALTLAGRRLALAADRDHECRDRPAVKASGRLEALALLELDQRLPGARAEHAIGVSDVEAVRTPDNRRVRRCAYVPLSWLFARTPRAEGSMNGVSMVPISGSLTCNAPQGGVFPC
jgi:hypothetical protein